MATQPDPPQTNPTAPPPSSDQKSCWECSRRRLVCDEVRPTCRKCRDAGIVCPGYSGAKPLRWLAPGRVNARIRRKPKRRGAGSTTEGRAKSAHAVAPADTADGKSPSSSSSGSSGERPSSGSWQLAKPGAPAEEICDVEVVRRPSTPRVTVDIPQPFVRKIFVSDETEIVQATFYCMPPWRFPMSPVVPFYKGNTS